MSAHYVQTEDRTLLRDTHSKALLTTDRAGLARNRLQRARVVENLTLNQKVATLQSVCTRLEDRINELTTQIQRVLRGATPDQP